VSKADQIARQVASGMTLAQVARANGVTTDIVWQIIQRRAMR
jgi:DNA-binding CsgD family transcriptional regulator